MPGILCFSMHVLSHWKFFSSFKVPIELSHEKSDLDLKLWFFFFLISVVKKYKKIMLFLLIE